jgi:predicted nucleic-acid-binding protein
MSIAIDTNVLVRIFVQDQTAPEQSRAAKRLVKSAESSGESLLVTLCALLETEWVLRSKYKLDKSEIAGAFTMLLETPGIELEDGATLEEALYLGANYPSSDFADCLLLARSTHLGRARFVTFDAGAAKLPRAELLS